MRLCGLGRGDNLVLRRTGLAERDILAQRPRKQEGILLDERNLGAQRFQVPVAHVDAIDRDRAAIDIEDAVDQPGQGRFAGAGLPDDGDGLARMRCETQAAEHGPIPIRAIPFIAEVHVLEPHLPANLLRHALRVLIQFGLGVDRLQDTLRTCRAELDEVEGEHGHARREPERAHQPQVGDGLAEGQVACAPQQ